MEEKDQHLNVTEPISSLRTISWFYDNNGVYRCKQNCRQESIPDFLEHMAASVRKPQHLHEKLVRWQSPWQLEDSKKKIELRVDFQDLCSKSVWFGLEIAQNSSKQRHLHISRKMICYFIQHFAAGEEIRYSRKVKSIFEGI